MNAISKIKPSVQVNKLNSRFVLIAAPFTAFDREGNLNLSQIRLQAQRLSRNLVDTAFICGTTGEGFSLSIEERIAVAESWREASRESLNLIVHVGHPCIATSIKLAQHAESIGAKAVASIGPCFFTPTDPSALVEMMRRIAESTSLPFYYYHMPTMARVPFKASELLPLLMHQIPTFAGIKFTHDDIGDFSTCVKIAGKSAKMLFGRDEFLLDGIKAGADGAVGSTYNYRTDVYRKVLDAFREGDLDKAESLQKKARDYVNIFVKYGGLNAGKALMKMSGIDCGAPRLPLAELSPASYAQMKEEFSAAGFFERLEPHEVL